MQRICRSRIEAQVKHTTSKVCFPRQASGWSRQSKHLSNCTCPSFSKCRNARPTRSIPKIAVLSVRSLSGQRAFSAPTASPTETGDDTKDDGKQKKTRQSFASAFRDLDRSLARDVAVLSGSQLMLNLGFSQMVPVMPLFVAQVGGHMGAAGVGMVMSAPSIAMFLLNVPLGRVCDTVGRLPLMYAGTAMTAVGAFLTAFSGSLQAVVACRLLVGAGVCASSAGSSAYMADLTDRAPSHRAKIMGANQAIAGSVWLVGPALGGWLAETYGFQNSFFIAAAGAASCSLGYTRLHETLKKDGKVSTLNSEGTQAIDKSWRAEFQRWVDDIRPLVLSGKQQALVAMSAVPALRFSCFSTVVTLHAAAVIGAGPQDIGLMFSALAISQGAAMPLGSYFADKSPGARLPLVMPPGLISCVSFASLGWATSLEHFLIAMAVQGFCAGFTVPSQGAFRVEITPPDKRGQAMSLERQVGSMISLSGPIALGLLSDITSAPVAIMFTSGLMAACHGLYFLRSRTSV